MSLRRKQSRQDPVVLIPRHATASGMQQQHHPEFYETGTGFSVAPNGAIGFSQEIESRLATMSVVESNNKIAVEKAAARARSPTPKIQSNRDAFARMQITCSSIVQPTHQQQQGALTMGDIFQSDEQYATMVGAPAATMYVNQDGFDQEEDEEEILGTGEDFVSAWEQENAAMLETGAQAAAYERNAKNVYYATRGGGGGQVEEMHAIAKKVLLGVMVKNAFKSWMKTKDGKEAMQGVQYKNIFKVMELATENKENADVTAVQDLEKKVLEITSTWEHTWGMAKSFKDYENWMKNLSYERDQKQSENVEEIKKLQSNIEKFTSIMKMFVDAIKTAESINVKYEDTPGKWELLGDSVFKKLISKGPPKLQRNGGQHNHARGGMQHKTQNVQHARNHVHKTHTNKNAFNGRGGRRKGRRSEFDDGNGGGMYHLGAEMGFDDEDCEDEEDGLDNADHALGNEFCQCGPHAIPVPIYSSAQLGSRNTVPVPKMMQASAPVTSASKQVLASKAPAASGICTCANPIPVPIMTTGALSPDQRVARKAMHEQAKQMVSQIKKAQRQHNGRGGQYQKGGRKGHFLLSEFDDSYGTAQSSNGRLIF